MATTIKLKNSVTTTNAPSSLVQGEVAINITDKKVWVGNAATTPIQLLGAGASGTFGALTCTSLTNSGLTSGRVTYATTAGLLTDSANLTFNGTTLTANTIGAFTLGGTISGGGNQINNIVIGASTPLAGAFTTLSASGVATFSAGTVSAPALTTTGDTNTGIFFPAADTIAFAEGGAEAMRIDSTGRLVVGGTSAVLGARIESVAVSNGDALALRGRSSDGNSNLLFIANAASTEYARISSANTSYLAFGTGSSGTERMRIDSSGNVGIGTSSPSGYRLSVFGGIASIDQSSSSGSTLTLNRSGNSGSLAIQVSGTEVGQIQGISGGGLNFYTGSTPTERMRITSGGEVYIAGTTDQGAYNLQVNGTGVWGAGAYVNGSDERIKDNIAPLDSGLDVVSKLNPVTYKYKEDWSKDQSTQTGFIAQELLTALEGKNYVDGVVQQGGEYMSVAYQNIIPILTKAIQEQQAMIEELKQEVALLKSK